MRCSRPRAHRLNRSRHPPGSTWQPNLPAGHARPSHQRAPPRSHRAIASSPPPAQAKPLLRRLTTSASAEQQGGKPRLLFVAHRVEILCQAIDTYRQAGARASLRRALADGHPPDNSEHLFATIMSVTARKLLASHGADYWNTVVTDECHHLPASQFDTFTGAIRPRVLLGLYRHA